MKIEIGKTYKTRNGGRVTVEATDPKRGIASIYPFSGRLLMTCLGLPHVAEDGLRSWTPSGRELSWVDGENDLVEEVPAALKLEVGNLYRTRDGNVVRVVRFDDNPHYPVEGILKRTPGGTFSYRWTEDGRFEVDRPNHYLDLVAPVEEAPTTSATLKIEAGKFYRTRGGKKVEVLAVCPELAQDYQVFALRETVSGQKTCNEWTLKGKYIHNFPREHECDIVSEWTEEPTVDWPSLPAWAQYVAQEESGHWYWYSEKPPRSSHSWGTSVGEFGLIPESHCPVFAGSWADSLTKRP